MYNKVFENIKKFNLINDNSTVIVGVSGGYDSMVLLNCLIELKKEINFKIIVAHINHMLRDEADNDENFVREYSKSFNLDFQYKRQSMEELSKDLKISIEDAGRRIRYGFFEELSQKYENSVIAVAHNLDDQVETILLNLLRGSGLSGLSGMAMKRDNIIRPLLNIKREEIEKYAELKSIPHKDDITNSQNLYRRNSIRNELIPFIENKYNPNIKNIIFKMSDLITEQLDIIDKVTKKNLNKLILERKENFIIIKKEDFNRFDLSMRKNIIREIIRELKTNLDGFEYAHYDEFVKTAKSDTGKYMFINNICLSNIYDKIKIEESNIRESYEKSEDKIKIKSNKSGKYIIGDYIIELNILKNEDKIKTKKNRVYFDLDKLGEHICIRTRRKGDRFQPFGMKGTKKVKDIFIDMKIDKDFRNKIPIITSQSGEIIWIVGLRRSALYPVDEHTKNILEIRVKEEN